MDVMEKLQKSIDEGKLSLEEQLSLMKDGVSLNYKLFLEELNDSLVNKLITNDIDVKFLVTNTENSRRLYRKFYEKSPYSFINAEKKHNVEKMLNKVEDEWNKNDSFNGKFNGKFTEENINELIDEGRFDLKEEGGTNMLIWAVKQRKFDIIRNILPYIDINSGDNEGKTPLMYASTSRRNGDVINFLINNGANTNTKDKEGKTALMHASDPPGNGDTIKSLIDNGANINDKDNRGRTALMHACTFSWNVDTIKSLIDNGANINEKDNEGKTALMYACEFLWNEDVIKLLIDNGADVNVKDKEGKTALMYSSVMRNNENVVNLLVSNGANINEQDNEGRTALIHSALIKGNETTTNSLIKLGANQNILDKYDRNALYYYVENSNEDDEDRVDPEIQRAVAEMNINRERLDDLLINNDESSINNFEDEDDEDFDW